MAGFLSAVSRVTVNFQQMKTSQEQPEPPASSRKGQREFLLHFKKTLMWMWIMNHVIKPLVVPQVLFRV